tara:strand:- start:604 stop:2025 length:1422 start_codon:yes stop_codon:yes gene_type:complete
MLSEVQRMAINDASSDTEQQLASTIRELHRLFLDLEELSKPEATSTPGLCILIEIIRAARRLHCSRSLREALDLSDYHDKQKTHICHTIEKLGRYLTVSKLLIRSAATFPIFADITVSFVSMPALPLTPIKQPTQFASTMLAGLLEAKQLKCATGTIQHQLKVQNLSHICSGIASKKFVVHAEIQLLFHYETYHPNLPPRILCSSKQACFLCNLFICEHGRFFVANTHGKLYEKWTFPSCLCDLSMERANSLLAVLVRFSNAINKELKSQILLPEKRFHAAPESLILGSAISSEVQELSLDPLERVDSGYDGGEKYTVASAAHTITSLLQSKSLVLTESGLPSKSTVRSRIVNTKSLHTLPYTILTIGEMGSFELSCYTRLVKVATPRIHLTFSYEAWEQSLTSLSNAKVAVGNLGCRLNITWLGNSPCLTPGSKVVDLAEATDIETFDQLSGSCDFYVKNSCDVVSVQTTYL